MCLNRLLIKFLIFGLLSLTRLVFGDISKRLYLYMLHTEVFPSVSLIVCINGGVDGPSTSKSLITDRNAMFQFGTVKEL